VQHHHESAPFRIGNHEWRVVIRDSAFSRRCTSYQWRSIGDGWADQRDWPGYNFNDGCYGGLPKALRQLYEREKAALYAVLAGLPVPQMGML
jgi:hypothetical protein